MQNGQFLAGSGEDLQGSLQEVDVSRNTSRNIIPRFFMGMQKRPDEEDGDGEISKNNGFREVEYVELLIPGDAKSAPVQLVDKNIRKLYAKSYAAFKEGRELPESGTPVEYWLGANDARVHVLKSLHLRTVEAVSEMSDAIIGNVGLGGRELRKRALAFLEAQTNNKVADKISSQATELEMLRNRLAVLEAGGPVSNLRSEDDDIVIEGASAVLDDDSDGPVGRRPSGASPVGASKAPSRKRAGGKR